MQQLESPLDDSADSRDDSADTRGEEAVDSRGIPGWNKVDKLAGALVKLRGLCVTNSQAVEIQQLYHDLHDFDKRPLVFQPRAQLPPRGMFGRKKRENGHIGIDAMQRYDNAIALS